MAKKNSVVGLDIGAASIKGVQASLKGGEVVIDKVASFDLPPDLIFRSEVNNVSRLSDLLGRFWKEAKFTTRNVALGMGGDRVLARASEFKWYPDSEFRKIFETKVTEIYPVDPKDYIFDFHTLREYPKREPHPTDSEEFVVNPKKYALIVGAERKAVQTVIAAAQGARLRPVSVDITGLALLRASRPELSAGDAADISIDIGAETLTITFHKFGQPMYIRIISDIGGRVITNEIAQEFKIPFEKAESRKLEAVSVVNPTAATAKPRESVFALEDDDTPTTVNVGQEIIRSREIVGSQMSQIIQAIRQTIETFLYSQRENDLTRLSPFVLSGGVAATPGLAERLSSEFQNSVSLATPLSAFSANVNADILEREHEFAIATGLAAGWMSTNG